MPELKTRPTVAPAIGDSLYGRNDSDATTNLFSITALIALFLDAGKVARLVSELNCSANPNYPPGEQGEYYTVAIDGKIGGALGERVYNGDLILCHVDNAGGSQLAVGGSWGLYRNNLKPAPIEETLDDEDELSYIAPSKMVLELLKVTGGVAASGSITFTDNPANNETKDINGVTITFKTSPGAFPDVQRGATLPDTVGNLETALNATANAALIVATYEDDGVDTLNIVFDTVGAAGNAFTLTGGTCDFTTSGSTLEGGSEGLEQKANLNSPALTGTPTAPTPSVGDNDMSIATTAFVGDAISTAALNLGKRQRVRVAATGNIAIATALNNGDTLDGVTLATGNLILVPFQSTPAENGVYVVGASPARAAEFDTYNEHPGALIAVQEGTANAETLWLCSSNDGGTLDSTAIAFAKINTILISDTAYGVGWNGVTDIAPSKNAVYDEMETRYKAGGTDVAVSDGGTGASTAPGAATNLGLGTGDSPQFTGVNFGHATDTTVTRASAGILAVEDVNLQKVSGPTAIETICIAASDEVTAISTGTAKVTFRMPFAMTLTEVRGNVNTAPTGSTVIIDINEAGSTILSTKLSIDASEKTSTTATSEVVISNTALADDAEITIDFDQVGALIAGKGVKVWLMGFRT